MSRVWGWTAFAKRSAAMKAPVGLLSGSAVCDSRWRGVVRLAHRKREVMAQYLVQTTYVRFKVQYEESRTQCGHYNLLFSSARITLYSCAINNQKQILED